MCRLPLKKALFAILLGVFLAHICARPVFAANQTQVATPKTAATVSASNLPADNSSQILLNIKSASFYLIGENSKYKFVKNVDAKAATNKLTINVDEDLAPGTTYGIVVESAISAPPLSSPSITSAIAFTTKDLETKGKKGGDKPSVSHVSQIVLKAKSIKLYASHGNQQDIFAVKKLDANNNGNQMIMNVNDQLSNNTAYKLVINGSLFGVVKSAPFLLSNSRVNYIVKFTAGNPQAFGMAQTGDTNQISPQVTQNSIANITSNSSSGSGGGGGSSGGGGGSSGGGSSGSSASSSNGGASTSNSSGVADDTDDTPSTDATGGTPTGGSPGGGGAPIVTGHTYYVANGGSDSNTGLSQSSPWQTVGKVNSIAATLQPGDSVLFKGGDIFRDDYLRCQNFVKATATTKLKTNQLTCSGSPGLPITFGSYGTGKAIFDGANPLHLTWSLVSGTTYQAQISSIPSKLYVDCPTSDCPQLLPVPNYVGVYDPTRSYKFLDAVTYVCSYCGGVGRIYVVGNTAGVAANMDPQDQRINNWIGITNNATLGNEGTPPETQTFPVNNTGLQNVEAFGNGSVWTAIGGGTNYANLTAFTSSGGGPNCRVSGTLNSVGGVPASITYTNNHGCTSIPTLLLVSAIGTGAVLQPALSYGSWYITGSPGAYTIYVNLPDGSNPNDHTFEGTYRPYGVFMASVDYVNIKNLAIEHTQKSCIVSYAYSISTYGYYTGEYNSFTNNSLWNCGDIEESDSLPTQIRSQSLEGGITVTADNSNNPHLLRGISISHNTIGTIDSYSGMRGTLPAGIYLVGIDGGGSANNLIASYDTISTTNGSGIIYNGTSGASGTTVPNNGGAIAYETLTNNQGNIYFGYVAGGRVHHNLITNSFGEGIQLGGSSTSTAANPQVMDHNIIANLGQSGSTIDANAIDCNGGAPNVFEINNTIYNTNSSGPTFEVGCTTSHFHNNIVDQQANTYQPGNKANGTINGSNSVYFVTGSNIGVDWSNNLWDTGANTYNPFFSFSLRLNCSNFFSEFPDKNSSCFTTPAKPMFVNPSYLVNNFALMPGSPAIGKGVAASASAPFATPDLGAIPYGSSTLF